MPPRYKDVEISRQHRALLEQIGVDGADSHDLRSSGREFSELDRDGLIVFWTEGAIRPLMIFGGGTRPGRWYITFAGAEALGIEPPPLRLRD